MAVYCKDPHKAMVGKMFKVAIGSRESLQKTNKILIEVETYIDGESGTLYIVPKEGYDVEDNPFLKNIGESFENLI